MLDLETVKLAERRIRPYCVKTPLIRCYALEKKLSFSGRLFLKCEHLQPTGSFKPRGAFNAMLQVKGKGVVARSSGNFSQAMAYAGSILNIPTTIVLPKNAPEVKKENTAKLGARVILGEGSYEEQHVLTRRIAETENLELLSPFNHPDVIAGAGTIALEIWDSLPTLAQYFCQIGGGGLMAGTSTTLKALNSRIETVGVEPIGANDYFLSRKAGRRIPLDSPNTIADGLRAPQVGELPWPLLQKNVDRTVTVTDEEIIGAMKFLFEEMGMIIEPSGVASLALLLYHPEQLHPQGDAVCVLSGCNVDRADFFKWIL